MALFVWNDSYSVKVAMCDEQHKKLFAIINDLADAMRMGTAGSARNRKPGRPRPLCACPES
jgi:hemerythrin